MAGNNKRKLTTCTSEFNNQEQKLPPLLSAYNNNKIRPILDAVDKLRRLNVTQQGIPLPTIVVVGDQSSGKSSVIESLTNISLPRGQGLSTRVPLIIRFQHHQDPVPEFILEFQMKSVKIMEESKISEAIDMATVEITGNNKGVTNVPITLVVKKNGVPDLTMIDLPGITRVPVRGQQENIYEQVSEIIMEHIKPKESIILNVLSATTEFSTCESIRMSRQVDITGERTLAVVTKSDRSPDDLYDEVTSNDVNIGLGYVCVRNRINDETYDEARTQETKLFETHPLLSMIDKSMVGVPILADKLVQIQAVIISKCLPDIVNKIKERLDDLILDLNKLPPNITSNSDALIVFNGIISSLEKTLRKVLIRGEFIDDLENREMCCNARLIEMVDEFSKEIHKNDKFSEKFLLDEIHVLEEAKGIQLPLFPPPYVFLCLLQKQLNNISGLPISFVNKAWSYIEKILVRVLIDHCGNYPQLLACMWNAAQNVMAKMKNKFLKKVVEMIEMEKLTNYTCDPDFVVSWNHLKSSNFAQFSQAMTNRSETMHIKGCGLVNLKHLFGVPSDVRDQAFDLKMMIIAYWKIVLKRMVDQIALQFRFMIQRVVNKEIVKEIVNEVMLKGGLTKMLAEPPSLAKQRERLQRSIALLQESKGIVEQVMYDIQYHS